MARHDRAGIFEAGVAFDAALSQVAQHAHKAANQAEPERLGKVQVQAGDQCEQPPDDHRADDARRKSLPSSFSD